MTAAAASCLCFSSSTNSGKQKPDIPGCPDGIIRPQTQTCHFPYQIVAGMDPKSVLSNDKKGSVIIISALLCASAFPQSLIFMEIHYPSPYLKFTFFVCVRAWTRSSGLKYKFSAFYLLSVTLAPCHFPGILSSFMFSAFE